MPWIVNWRVLVDDRDVSENMRPYLLSVTVADKDGTVSDTCALVFDDTAGQIKLPAQGARVQVFLQGVRVFEGVVDTVRFNLARGGGRTLNVSAKGFDAAGKVKEPQSHHMDNATLGDFLGKAAGKAGLAGVAIAPEFARIFRDYWSMEAESFLHLGQKLARELNATFKIRGDQAVLAKRGDGQGPGGTAMPVVAGIVGRNLVSCDIAPVATRRKFTKTVVRYFDRASAAFKTIEVETDIEGATAVNELRAPAADAEQARTLGEARRSEGEREGGEGSVELDLAVEAQAEGTFVLSGARPGVDGVYRIVGVTHRADRGGGATTGLEIKQPSGGAGEDDRSIGVS